MKTRIGILGYGNLGRGIECAIRETNDMELVAVFTRRNPQTVSILTEDVPVLPVSRILTGTAGPAPMRRSIRPRRRFSLCCR